jgi:hypothetical protein
MAPFEGPYWSYCLDGDRPAPSAEIER